MKLCLNMIVRSEGARIERCLKSVLPYISSYAIVDTGSIDNTVDLIRDVLKDIPGVIEHVPFENFEQARNAALKSARCSTIASDYLLLTDADMELAVEDSACFDGLTGASYDIIQKSGSLSYHNRRLVRTDQTGVYKGVTHEFLDVAGAGCLAGVHFVDHADGSNRKDKFGRDIELLLADLRDHPANERSWFYLAQSYRDNGQPAQAAQAYRRRFEMGGWDEEVWNARVNYAHCLNTMGDEGGFIREMLAAYNYRPSRAEVLYDLAKHFREKGQNFASLLFSERGMELPSPPDVLFINDHVYEAGLKEEFSIAAFYDPARRDRGFKAINELMLNRKWDGSRELAKHNSFHYIRPLSSWVPSFKAHKIDFTPPDGYTPLNPSIVNWNDRLITTVRTVNYTITADGRYEIRGGDGSITNDNPINTRNFIVDLDNNLNEVGNVVEVLWDRPEAQFKPVVGLEDMRLFVMDGQLWASACVREQNQEGWCEQVVVKLERDWTPTGVPFVAEQWRTMCSGHKHHEKNWMPWDGKFVYRLGSVVDNQGRTVATNTPALYTDTLSGGSQVIRFAGAWLAVVHEARHRPDSQRYYQHRFALMDDEGKLQKLSTPFVFHDRQIEFAAGLCWHPGHQRLLVSYGVRDEEAWIAEMDWHDVMEMFL